MVNTQSSAINSTFKTVFGMTLLTVGFLATMATLLGFFGSFWWAFDVLADYRLQLAAVLTITGILYGLVLSRGAALIFIVAAIVNLAIILPMFISQPLQAVGAERMTLASIQIDSAVDSGGALLRWVEESGADMVFLLERRHATPNAPPDWRAGDR